jgi:dihydrofolate reductase
MGKIVTSSISVSLDGYFTGPDPSPEQMLGTGGDVLHDWLGQQTADRDQLMGVDMVREVFDDMGAMITGRDSYEVAQRAWGPEPPFRVPVFVLTHRQRPDDVRTGTTFAFVTDGFEAAVARARAAAGGKDIALHGGTAIQQALKAGVLDELQIHLVPVLLGGGRRLLDDIGAAGLRLEHLRTVDGPGVTHLKYRVAKDR